MFRKFALRPVRSHEFHYVYDSIGCLFRHGGEKLIQTDAAGKTNIRKYIAISENNDSVSHLKGAKEPVVIWGLGAYLRRICLKDDFPQNIAAIIDRDQGASGKTWRNAPITTRHILTEQAYQHCTVIITSALYAEEIKKEIAAMNFQGAVLTAF